MTVVDAAAQSLTFDGERVRVDERPVEADQGQPVVQHEACEVEEGGGAARRGVLIRRRLPFQRRSSTGRRGGRSGRIGGRSAEDEHHQRGGLVGAYVVDGAVLLEHLKDLEGFKFDI